MVRDLKTNLLFGKYEDRYPKKWITNIQRGLEYIGPMVDGLPNGYGDVNHDGRLMYEGNLVNGKPVGLGIFRFHPFLVWHDNIEFLQVIQRKLCMICLDFM